MASERQSSSLQPRVTTYSTTSGRPAGSTTIHSRQWRNAYEFTPDINTYAKYVQGYRAGGFNLRDPQITGTTKASDGVTYGYGFVTGFGPEHLSSVEMGVKSEWFDRSVRINADVFRTPYHDMQVPFIIGGTLGDTKEFNAGTARMQGAELDALWAVTRWMKLFAEYSFLDAKAVHDRIRPRWTKRGQPISLLLGAAQFWSGVYGFDPADGCLGPAARQSHVQLHG